MKEEKWLSVIKWFCYFSLLILCYTLQTIPNLFRIFGIKPVLILPLAICICMFEGVMGSAVFCMITGLLWDISSDKLFGFNAIILVCCGVFFALLCIYYLRAKLLNAMMFCGIAIILQGLLDYTFYYALWGFENHMQILTTQILPTGIYTLLISPILFFIVSKIAGRFSEVKKT